MHSELLVMPLLHSARWRPIFGGVQEDLAVRVLRVMVKGCSRVGTEESGLIKIGRPKALDRFRPSGPSRSNVIYGGLTLNQNPILSEEQILLS